MSSRWAAFMFMMLLCPVTAVAQRTDVLYGRVTAEDGRPLVGARVEAISVLTEYTISQITGRDGRYLILFPESGGTYVLRVSYIGMGDEYVPVVRAGSEELLLTNVTLASQAISLEEIVVSVPGGPRLTTDEGTLVLTKDILDRLPLPDREPETIAQLQSGVIGTGYDPDADRLQFSVGGMREELNQMTVDGVALGDVVLDVPREGVQQVEVTTTTFDAAQGGFAGGRVAVTSARGNQWPSGTLTYGLDTEALQLRASPTANAFTKHDFGGSYGGPLRGNRLFYNLSFQRTLNENYRFALAADDPLAAQRSGVNSDSIGRFLSILQHHDFAIAGQTGQYSQLTSDVRLQGRLDWHIVQESDRAHTLSARLNTNLNTQDSTRISSLDVMQHGGEAGRNTRQLSLNLDSRIGRRWTNVFNVSVQDHWSDSQPFLEIPEGQVRVTSEFDDGTRGTRNLIFGGNRQMPTEVAGHDVGVSEELSLVIPWGQQVHRLKVGGSLERSRSLSRSATNLFGAFRYSSLEDFRQNLPDRYERTLTPREEDSGRSSISLFLSDVWKVRDPLEITLGLRWDYSRLDQRPDHNPLVESAFGLRTDIVPSSSALSPRMSFSYTLPQAGRGNTRRAITGGIGYFAGRAPMNIFTAAVRQTGLPNAEQTLICIGSAVPVPDWELYRRDPSAVPTACADGGPGAPSSQSSRAPAVTVIQPNQPLPGSIRFEGGYRTPLPLNLTGNFRYQYSLGQGLWGYRDLNLDDSRSTLLGPDDRIFFGDPLGIVERTGSVSMASSRLHAEFANVYEVASSLRSVSHQFTAQVNGTLPRRIRTNANYTLGFARDQGSGTLQQNTTGGNPNELEWAAANTDRRHNLNLTLTMPVHQALELTANTRVQSGAPFTPLVNRDVNGDGLRNDRAFIFDPLATQDTSVVNGMTRLMAIAPGRIQQCLQAQFGRVADRNSCRNGWTQTLNIAANFRPMLPNLQRRLTVTANLRNVLTGVDYLVHGRDGMRGWGEGQRADANLLEVVGFSRETRTFRYQVNEGYGQDNRGPEAFRNAFSLTISARMAIGGNPAQASRGFLPAPSGGGSGGARAAAAGGRAPQQAGGGRAAADTSGAPAAGAMPGAPSVADAPAPFQIQHLAAMIRAADADQTPAAAVVETLLANPLRPLLAMSDSVALSAEEAEWIVTRADSLDARLEAIRGTIARAVAAVTPEILSPGGDSAFFGGQSDAARIFEAEIQPGITAARQEIALAARAVQQQLTREQWARVPPEMHAATAGAQQAGGGGPQSFVGAIDRMLANPLLVLLDLRETLQLAPAQLAALQRISDELQEKLGRRRESLGSRFDNAPGPQQAQIFQRIQPEIEAGRGEIREALRTAEGILTPVQWGRLPAAVRDPFVATEPAAE
jgi:hypothetical protein